MRRWLSLTALLALASAAPAEAQIALGPASNFAAGTDPRHVTIADVNADTRNDLIVTAEGSGVGVLLGNGDGTFQALVNNPAGVTPRHTAVGFLNGDAFLDMVTTNLDSDNLSKFFGNGTGTFGAAQPTNLSLVPADNDIDPYGIVLGRFNADANLDVAVTASGPNTNHGDRAIVLTGDGTGILNFPPASETPVGGAANSQPLGIAGADVDGDGDLDLATANQGTSNVSVLKNNGSATTFTAANLPSGMAQGVALRNFGGNPRPDLAVGNFDGTVGLRLNLGAGVFGSVTNFLAGLQTRSLTAGDIDLDGLTDVALADAAGLSVLRGLGGGRLAGRQAYSAGTTPQHVALGDLNGDGRPDVAVANEGSDNVTVRLGRRQPPEVRQPQNLEITRFRVDPPRFRRAAGSTPVTARKRKRRKAAKKGSAFRYSLSRAATVSIVIERRTRGRRVGGKCRKATRKRRRRKRCVRYVKVGTFTRAAKAGENKHRFTGRVGRSRLKIAIYRASARATAGAVKSQRRRVEFRIVQR